MRNSDRKKKRLRLTLFIVASTFYVLEGALVNPFILWTALPLYVGYSVIRKAWETGSVRKLRQGYGFLVVSVGFSYLYHLAWFFDWGAMKTGSSTSAIIFVWFPVYALVFGYIGYFVGLLVPTGNRKG